MKKWLAGLVLAIGVQGAVMASERAETAWQWVDEGAVLVDVRTTEEFAAGHLPGAINIPLDQLPSRLAELGEPGAETIVVYCRSGNRSGQALGWLNRQGYEKVHNGGGLEEMRQSRQ
ncbi:rhodanese-like domain-containing protein [Ferrimonas balearica]|uniref:rhodanese-like domain-containing protein n=1 Tax=Ferrimonas balearica TaxID=44012 RepID=UPI001C997214|nr:rhodanese-like domain-containing protein [Ferrimonas balearica]MBY5922093.1 rhodanese-like domain-containing protein [Ferrimonas balearica]MBY5994567.1 rhodanese-like domain-containing protein [Ferrimonas balearica]